MKRAIEAKWMTPHNKAMNCAAVLRTFAGLAAARRLLRRYE